jgi:hypothetical protein
VLKINKKIFVFGGGLRGVLVAWRTDRWQTSHIAIGVLSVTLHLEPIEQAAGDGCWLTVVYGPTDHALKEGFLLELEGLAANHGLLHSLDEMDICMY